MDYSKIEVRRKQLNMKQDELASLAGISLGGLQKILYNKSTSVPTLEKISKALKVNMTYWFSDDEAKMITVAEPSSNYQHMNGNNSIKEFERIIDSKNETIRILQDYIISLKRQLELCSDNICKERIAHSG